MVSRVSLHILYLGSTLRQLWALLLLLMLRDFIYLSIILFYDLDRFTCISLVSRVMLYTWCFFHFCLFCAFKFYLSISLELFYIIEASSHALHYIYSIGWKTFMLYCWSVVYYQTSIMFGWFVCIYIPLKVCFVHWCCYKNLFFFHTFTMHQGKSLTIMFCFLDIILFQTLLYFEYSFLYECRL